MAGQLVKWVWFEVCSALGEIEFRGLPVGLEIRLFKGLKAGCDGLVGKDENRRGIFLGEAAGLKRGVKAVFDISGSQDDAGSVAV